MHAQGDVMTLGGKIFTLRARSENYHNSYKGDPTLILSVFFHRIPFQIAAEFFTLHFGISALLDSVPWLNGLQLQHSVVRDNCIVIILLQSSLNVVFSG